MDFRSNDARIKEDKHPLHLDVNVEVGGNKHTNPDTQEEDYEDNPQSVHLEANVELGGDKHTNRKSKLVQSVPIKSQVMNNKNGNGNNGNPTPNQPNAVSQVGNDESRTNKSKEKTNDEKKANEVKADDNPLEKSDEEKKGENKSEKQMKGTIEVSSDKNTIIIRIKKGVESTSDRDCEQEYTRTKNKKVQCLIQGESPNDIQELANGNVLTSSFTVSCRADDEGGSNSTNNDSSSGSGQASNSRTVGGSECSGDRQCVSDDLLPTTPCLSPESYFIRMYGHNTFTNPGAARPLPCDNWPSSYTSSSGCRSLSLSCSWRPRKSYCSKYFRKESTSTALNVASQSGTTPTAGVVEDIVKKREDMEEIDDGSDDVNGNHYPILEDDELEVEIDHVGNWNKNMNGNGYQTLDEGDDFEEVTDDEKEKAYCLSKEEENDLKKGGKRERTNRNRERNGDEGDEGGEENRKETKNNDGELKEEEEKKGDETDRREGRKRRERKRKGKEKQALCEYGVVRDISTIHSETCSYGSPRRRSSPARPSFKSCSPYRKLSPAIIPRSANSSIRIHNSVCNFAMPSKSVHIPSRTPRCASPTKSSCFNPSMPLDPSCFTSKLFKMASPPKQCTSGVDDRATPPSNAPGSTLRQEKFLPVAMTMTTTLRRWRRESELN